MAHSFPFDPTYGYDLDGLLKVAPPPIPEDFASFWLARYERALSLDPRPEASPSGIEHPCFRVLDLHFTSTDDFPIGGWLLVPRGVEPTRAFVMGHGYGGIDGPDFELPFDDAVYAFPCFRGLSRSRRAPISAEPRWHVLHDIDKPGRYILGGCAEDLWLSVSAVLQRFPSLEGHLGYMGISLGGGVGALAMPWDARIRRVHLNVPSFGHHPLRLRLPTTGSGSSVQQFQQRHGNVMETLAYYDAASAAAFMDRPVHVAAALFDPVVAPPGQFAVYNALKNGKRLFVLEAGHYDYPDKASQQARLMADLEEFFRPL
ncbi:acetylxylan esterase [Endothiovibrio diazotrophicus]